MSETGHGRANPGDSGLGQRSGIAGPSQAKSRICGVLFRIFQRRIQDGGDCRLFDLTRRVVDGFPDASRTVT